MMPPEGLLKDAELALAGQTFDRAHRRAITFDRELRAAPHSSSVDDHGTGAADAVFAAYMRAVEPQFVAQKIR